MKAAFLTSANAMMEAKLQGKKIYLRENARWGEVRMKVCTICECNIGRLERADCPGENGILRGG